MRQFLTFVVVLLVVVVAVGIYLNWFHVSVDKEKINQDKDKAEKKLEEMKGEVQAGVEKMSSRVKGSTESTRPDETGSEKAEYQRKVEAELKSFDGRLDELKARAEKASGEARKDLDRDIDTLTAKRQAAQKQLEDLQSAGAEKWQDMKTGMEKALKDLKEAYDKAASRS